MSSVETAGGRGERRGRRPARVAGDISQLPSKQPRNLMPPVDLVSADQLESIHEAALTILEEIGMDVLLPEARDILQAAGAKVDGLRVRADRELVLGAVANAPAEFTMHARNPAHDLRVGGNWMMFSPVASPPNCSDLEGGRRPGNRADFRNFLKLGQTFNILHLTGGYTVEPIDIPPDVRHLEALRDIYTMTDKPTHSYSLGWGRIRDGIEMCRIARGIDRAQLEREPSLMTIINTSSPLRLDSPMAAGIIEMARAGQIVVLTPFTLAGAMAPVTVAGAVAQQNAEALLGIALTQLVRPGAPVIYGGFTSNVDMKSGAPAFGTPEYMKSVLVGGQLARRYNLPYRSSNTCAANSVDGQAMYEFDLLALGRGHGPGQPGHALGRLARGRPVRLVREAGDRRRHAADGGVIPGAAAGRRIDPGAGCRARGRPGRPFLRLRPYAGAVPHRVLRAAGVGLAQLRELARGRGTRRRAPRQPDLQGTGRVLRAAADRPGGQGRAGRLRRQAGQRRRRAERVLSTMHQARFCGPVMLSGRRLPSEFLVKVKVRSPKSRQVVMLPPGTSDAWLQSTQ